MSATLHTRADGLRLIAEPLPHMETVAVAISVDVGARWEESAQHGLSHLLEHMAFKGTSRYSAQDIAELFDAIGGHFNAFTSHEHTVYYVKVLKEHWQQACDILCNILCDSQFDGAELEREKQVILQELAMHHDTPDDLVFDIFQEASFGDQPLGRSILGTEESIASQSRDALVAFVRTHYHPSRICVSAAGAIEPDTLLRFFDEHLPAEALSDAQSEPLSDASYLGTSRLIHKKLEQLQLVIGLPGLPIHDARYYALQLLSTMLGGGMSSRLFQEIREKRGLVYSIQSFQSSYAECGVFGIYAATSPAQVSELLEATVQEIARFASTATEAELARGKQQLIAGLRMAREQTSTLAEWMGRHVLQFGEYRDAEALSGRIEAVRLEEIRALADKLLRTPRLSLCALGPTQPLKSALAKFETALAA